MRLNYLANGNIKAAYGEFYHFHRTELVTEKMN